MTEQKQAEGPLKTLNRQSKDVDGNGFLYSEAMP